jgi:hypothetical protein
LPLRCRRSIGVSSFCSHGSRERGRTSPGGGTCGSGWCRACAERQTRSRRLPRSSGNCGCGFAWSKPTRSAKAFARAGVREKRIVREWIRCLLPRSGQSDWRPAGGERPG